MRIGAAWSCSLRGAMHASASPPRITALMTFPGTWRPHTSGQGLKKRQNTRRKQNPMRPCALLVPDISPNAASAALESNLRAAAYTLVKDMSLLELFGRTALEVGLAFGAATLASNLMRWISRKAEENVNAYVEEEAEEDPSVEDPRPVQKENNILRIMVDTAVTALQQPVRWVMPLAASLHALRTVLLAMQILSEHQATTQAKFQIARHVASKTTQVLAWAEAQCLGLSEIAVVMFVMWFFIAWNNRLVQVIVCVSQGKEGSAQGSGYAQRLLVPLSNLASWAIVAVGALCCAQLLGVDIRPLLAVGGMGGLAIGFGAQQITSNAMSAISVFFTRVFVVGERVTFRNQGGGDVVTGVVERVDPMRTLLRTDSGMPIALPNSAVMNYIVVNQSRLRQAKQLFRDPRQYSTSVTVQCADVRLLPTLCEDLELMLEGLPGVDKMLPLSAGVSKYQGGKADVQLLASTAPTRADASSKFTAALLVGTAAVLEKHGMSFA